ncbi:hypothetical protein GGR58DRAFT_464433 [Xylaria digitata]|nr:hypothetical protein GGR58DRAFT_464433 [Xylaria digitata]
MEFISDRMTPPTAKDMKDVFLYAEAPATVITLLGSHAEIEVVECKTGQEWDALIRELPSINESDGDSGLVLLMTPRISANMRPKHTKSPAFQCDGDEKSSRIRHESILFEDERSLGPPGQRKARILPFSQEVFSRISEALYIHRSISPAINRADVPLFSHEEVSMQGELCKVRARVYNCRSTNAWGGDLAMTVTHFPHCGLSFGILFGCTESHKKYILGRLNLAAQDSAHPLLLPGLFAEIEKKRHRIIFEAGVSKLELMVAESDTEASLGQVQSPSHSNRQEKKSVYLDMLHLKHGLTSWSRQLNKMLEHARSLEAEYPRPSHQVYNQAVEEPHGDLETASDSSLEDSVYYECALTCGCSSDIQRSTSYSVGNAEPDRGLKVDQESMARTNSKIIKRVRTILEDYYEDIRECQTRFEGLTMTTQLSQGETSVILGLTTSQDSRHMRTIALVTMVFLPGTFFATIFSMTFFNWQAEDGESTVSSFFWVYIAFSVVSTAATLLAYYYFVTIRPKKALVSSASL